MPEAWFTTDTHFGHELVAGLRGFATVGEHDDTILANISKPIQPRDDLYVLGDFSLKQWREALGRFAGVPGHKHLVFGNHDRGHPMKANGHKYQREYLEVFESVSTLAELRRDGHRIILSHFPYDGEGTQRPDERDRALQYRAPDLGSILLHGHVHDDVKFRLSTKGSPMVHVGLDAWGLRPVTLHDALAVIPAATSTKEQHHDHDHKDRPQRSDPRLHR